MKTACLGPDGSYSSIAAQMSGTDEIILCRTFHDVMRSLSTGESDFAVVPVENSIQGGVPRVLDLLATENVFADREVNLSIDHRLATLPGVKLQDVRRVYSHEQAIGQCTRFLDTYLPWAERIYTDSTSRSLSLLDANSAGIVGGHMRLNGIVLSEENIADEKNNVTRFLRLIRRGNEPDHSSRVFFMASCKHEAGALMELLKVFTRYGLNLTRIASRPIRDQIGKYRFYIEFAGDISDGRVRSALHSVEEQSLEYRLIGAY